jgi:hypothetical protein
MAYVCTGSRESEGPYARRIGTQRIGAAGGDLRERKTRHESVPHGSCCSPVFAYRRYEWCGQMYKVSAPLPKAITFSCVRVPASKAAPSFLVWPALPVQAAGVWHCTESVRLQSLERRGDLHPTRDARARASSTAWRRCGPGAARPRDVLRLRHGARGGAVLGRTHTDGAGLQRPQVRFVPPSPISSLSASSVHSFCARATCSLECLCGPGPDAILLYDHVEYHQRVMLPPVIPTLPFPFGITRMD